MTAYTAAGIAQDSWFKIALTAMRLGIVAYVVPFVFVYSPALLFEDSISVVLITMGTALVGFCLLATGFTGWFINTLWVLPRVLLCAGGVLLVLPGFRTDYLSVPLIIVGLVVQWLYQFSQKKKLAGRE